MSFSKTDTSTQQKLSFLTDRIENIVLSKGYEIPRSEIIGYLIEYFVLDASLDEARLADLVGSVENITTEIVAMKDIQWPQAPWYGKEIKYPLEETSYKQIDQARSTQFMNFYTYLQMALMLPSIYVLIMTVLSFSLALIRGDPNSFTMSIGFETNKLFIFYYFGIYSITIFPLTAKISNNKRYRAGVDDMEAWLHNMKRLSYFQTFSYVSFCLLMFIGSFAEIQISDTVLVYETHPANRIALTTTLLYILFTTFFYYQGISILYNSASGRILREHLAKPSRRSLTIGISGITLSKSITTLVLANLTIRFFELLKLMDEAFAVKIERSVENYFTILVLIYFSLDAIILAYLKYSIPSPFTRLLRSNTIKNNTIQFINWLIFISLYSLLSIRIIEQDISESGVDSGPSPMRDYFISADFVRIIILTALHMIFMWMGFILTRTHKGSEFDDELINPRDYRS